MYINYLKWTKLPKDLQGDDGHAEQPVPGFVTVYQEIPSIPEKVGRVTTKELSVGGSFIDLDVHFIDLAHWFKGIRSRFPSSVRFVQNLSTP
jgi:predicted dehydrogenase